MDMKDNVIKLFSRKKKRISPKVLFAVLAVLLFLTGTFFVVNKKKTASAAASAKAVKTAVVEKQDITAGLSSSGTIAPKDTYNITSMAEGEVVEADFEEGDTVTEGQVLYRINASSMESKLNSAVNTLERAQSNYEAAAKEYSEAAAKFSGNTYKSAKTGYIKKLYIDTGDKVGSNGQVADIYNDQVMRVKIPFLSTEAANIGTGMEAVLTLSDTLEQLTGTVVSVSSMEEAMTGGRLIRYVTIQTENPGGLTTVMAATASIGGFVSTGDGTFTPTVDSVMAADLPSAVEVETLLVNEGDFVSAGTPIFKMKASTAEKLIKSYKDSMDSAQSNLEQARSGLDTTQENYDNYTITAPISGKVIQKNTKVGDKVQNSNGASDLAVIYDLSAMTFDMNIDELDIIHVAVGQAVSVNADAFEGEKFNGVVTKVSLEGTSANGVTYYPVTVTLEDSGSLLPGMNVDGEIVTESAEAVLAVPADALVRGNKVYVKDDTVKEANGNIPAGFRAVEVETGVTSSDYVEIVSGELKEGDEVYVAATSVRTSGSGAVMMMPSGGVPGGDTGAAPMGGSGSGRGAGSSGYSGGSRPQ